MGHLLQDASLFVTGGAGTLGRAIAQLRKQENWTGKLTVYSTDEHKHAYMRALFPDVRFVQGDIRNAETLYNAMVGHDVVIHAAAVKVIPVSEEWCIDTIDVNVYGSQNVCAAALRADVRHVLAISTDKACHPANLYGATKMAMEKILQEYARLAGLRCEFHLLRYGNVLESTGSVIETWKNAIANGEMIKMTDPEMTRFWLSPMEAARYVVQAMDFASGMIFVPKMPALSVGKLADYALGWQESALQPRPIEKIPVRPGEKMHETLLTIEETARCESTGDFYLVYPSTFGCSAQPQESAPYTSDRARQLNQVELMSLLRNE